MKFKNKIRIVKGTLIMSLLAIIFIFSITFQSCELIGLDEDFDYDSGYTEGIY